MACRPIRASPHGLAPDGSCSRDVPWAPFFLTPHRIISPLITLHASKRRAHSSMAQPDWLE